MIVLHQSQISPFCDKIRRVLHYKQRAYEVREVAIHETLGRLAGLNPVGKVPVIEHDANVIADSSDISRYLDRVFPDPPIFPEDPRDRALCHFLEDWADEGLYFFEIWFRFALPENASEWSRRSSRSEPPLLRRATERALPTLMRNLLKAQGLGRREPLDVLECFTRHIAALAGWLNGDWLVGDRLSIADIAVYAQLACAADTGEGAAVLADHEPVMAWMERVNAATAG